MEEDRGTDEDPKDDDLEPETAEDDYFSTVLGAGFGHECATCVVVSGGMVGGWMEQTSCLDEECKNIRNNKNLREPCSLDWSKMFPSRMCNDSAKSHVNRRR